MAIEFDYTTLTKSHLPDEHSLVVHVPGRAIYDHRPTNTRIFFRQRNIGTRFYLFIYLFLLTLRSLSFQVKLTFEAYIKRSLWPRVVNLNEIKDQLYVTNVIS